MMARAMEEHSFGEQELSIRLLEENRESLVAEAREVLAQHPGLRLVGAVMTGNSREAMLFHEQKAKEGAAPAPPGAGVVTLMLREEALALLRAITPHQLEFIESDPDKLPLLCVTAHGTRLSWEPLST